jgi:hypothetical protein
MCNLHRLPTQPQVVVSMEEGSKVDIFAFGMLFYAMCSWKPPFSGHRPLQILAFITLQRRRPSLASVQQFPRNVRVTHPPPQPGAMQMHGNHVMLRWLDYWFVCEQHLQWYVVTALMSCDSCQLDS